MDYKDFIKPGEKVIHLPERMDDSLWWHDPQVVTIGEYRPYYTDGTPDPTPEEYNPWCWVEVEEYPTHGDKQLPLDSLIAIKREDGEMIYDSVLYKVYGYDEEREYVVLIDEEGELIVASALDCFEHVEISDLSRDEAKELRGQICVGSIYLTDYDNTLGLTNDEVCQLSDSYLEWLEAEKLEDNAENFANFIEFAA